MIYDVLDAFRKQIMEYISKVSFEGMTSDQPKVDVEYVKADTSDQPLTSNAINLMLFTARERRDLLGTPEILAPKQQVIDHHPAKTQAPELIHKIPNLRISLDVLLIFNFKLPQNAIDCFNQVLGLFYTHNTLQVSFDGYHVAVEVLLSGFDDRNEIEIRNSFHVPGAPLLRYDLNFALIQGVSKKVPGIDKITLDTEAKEGWMAPYFLQRRLLDPLQQGLDRIRSHENNYIRLETSAPVSWEALIQQGKEISASYDQSLELIRNLIADSGFKRYKPVLENLKQHLEKNKLKIDPATQRVTDRTSAALQDTYHQKIRETQVDTIASKEVLKTNIQLIYDQEPRLSNLIEKLNAFNKTAEEMYELHSGLLREKELSSEHLIVKWWQFEYQLKAVQYGYDQEIQMRLPGKSTAAHWFDYLQSLSKKLEDPVRQVDVMLKAHTATMPTKDKRDKNREKPYFSAVNKDMKNDATTPNFSNPATRMSIFKAAFEALNDTQITSSQDNLTDGELEGKLSNAFETLLNAIII